MPRLCETEAKAFVSDEWFARDSPRRITPEILRKLVEGLR